jgi:hypothetical protein
MLVIFDDDDCEQWAAYLLADASQEVTCHNRSSSDFFFSSNDCGSNLSQIPAGFWQVPPSQVIDGPYAWKSSYWVKPRLGPRPASLTM